MIHPSTLDNYPGSMEALAEEIGDLRYDTLSEFLALLASKIQRDGDKDASRSRVKLASHLHECARHLRASKDAIDRAWVICEPYT
ncbi:MAG: hypothetical protein D6722_05210 [Bacteroidetes bacterium]|nr:MAG: hypothetical protein D6722_05210 [Bacteroidota bacterium]